MTLITFKDGKPVMRDGLIGTEQQCCCPQCSGKKFVCIERVWSTIEVDICDNLCTQLIADTDPSTILIHGNRQQCNPNSLWFLCPDVDAYWQGTWSIWPSCDGVYPDEFECGTKIVQREIFYDRYRAVESCEDCIGEASHTSCADEIEFIECKERHPNPGSILHGIEETFGCVTTNGPGGSPRRCNPSNLCWCSDYYPVWEEYYGNPLP